MTIHQAQPRFVHMQNPSGYGGTTVAYVRDDNNVFFAYATCSEEDRYVKEIGRDISVNRLLTNIDELNADFSNVDPVSMTGALANDILYHVLSESELTAIFADSTIENMTWTDVKHAFVSAVLAGYLNNSI